MTRWQWCLGLVLVLSGCPLFELGMDEGASSLQWQDPPAPFEMGWNEATSYCDALEQGGHSDWRLPSIDELRTLVVGCERTQSGGVCPVSEGCLDASCSRTSTPGDLACSCEDMPKPADGCFHAPGYSERCGCFKSSSPVNGDAPSLDYHWELCFDRGYVTSSPASTAMSVRCVRGSLGGGGGDHGGGFPGGDPSYSGGSPSGGGSFPATRHTYTGEPATRRFGARTAQQNSTSASWAMTTFSTSVQRGVAGGAAIPDSGGSCGDGSAFICSPGGCCGAGVTSTPTACCQNACCTDTAYCDFETGGCGYSCDAELEIDCGDGSCCPTGTVCLGGGQCESEEASCPDGTLDCGDGSCCPSGTECNFGSCNYPPQCDGGTEIDCGDGTCCPNGSSCTGAGECEEQACDFGVECDGACCNAGDQCLGGGECAPLGCEDFEIDCGGGYCCPQGTSCNGSECMEPEPEPEPEPDPTLPEPPVGGTPSGNCDTEDLLAALGGASSGNGCVDGCIQEALRCAGAAGCVLTQACQDAEVACVTACFQ